MTIVGRGWLMRTEDPGIGAELPMNCWATMPAVATSLTLVKGEARACGTASGRVLRRRRAGEIRHYFFRPAILHFADDTIDIAVLGRD